MKEMLYSLYRKLGGPEDQSAWVQKISPPLGLEPQTIQPVVSHYTKYTTLGNKSVLHPSQKQNRIMMIVIIILRDV
jgi:hypothetical protein